MSIPRFNLADTQFLAAVGSEVFQVHLLRRRVAVARTQNEVSEWVRCDGNALPQLGRKLNMRAAIGGRSKPGAQRNSCRDEGGLCEETSSCDERQSGHSLSDLGSPGDDAESRDKPKAAVSKTCSGEALG